MTQWALLAIIVAVRSKNFRGVSEALIGDRFNSVR